MTFLKITGAVIKMKFSQIISKEQRSQFMSQKYRHAILEVDDIESTMEEPNLITEHFFVISSDEKHHQFFTHHCQKLVSEYLKYISCDVHTMHEFCDGCTAQYKSRHCFGDVSESVSEFGYTKRIRNFF